MQQYLKIENEGVAPIAGFTVLGMSTSRGDASKVGNFGSGSKFGVLSLIRSNIDPIIYLGTDKLTYYTRPETMGDKIFQRVGYRFRTKNELLSVSLDFGSADWTDVSMGLREYVSNAIDAANGDVSKIKIEIVDNARAKTGLTRVFIPITPAVLDYYRSLSNNYLHFTGKQKSQVIIKQDVSHCRIYLKGVYVRTLNQLSYCDYNFGEEIKIDESRNMDDYYARYYARHYFKEYCPVEVMVRVLSNNTEVDALELVSNGRSLGMSEKRKVEFEKEFKKQNGENSVIATPLEGAMVNFAAKKGIKSVMLRSEEMRSALSEIVPTVSNCDDSIINGCSVQPLRIDTQKRVEKVWAWLNQIGMTANKDIPEIASFSCIMTGGSEMQGFHIPNTNKIYINEQNPVATNVILEELGHYITNSTDGSQDFQDWAFKVAGKIIELMENS